MAAMTGLALLAAGLGFGGALGLWIGWRTAHADAGRPPEVKPGGLRQIEADLTTRAGGRP